MGSVLANYTRARNGRQARGHGRTVRRSASIRLGVGPRNTMRAVRSKPSGRADDRPPHRRASLPETTPSWHATRVSQPRFDLVAVPWHSTVCHQVPQRFCEDRCLSATSSLLVDDRTRRGATARSYQHQDVHDVEPLGIGWLSAIPTCRRDKGSGSPCIPTSFDGSWQVYRVRDQRRLPRGCSMHPHGSHGRRGVPHEPTSHRDALIRPQRRPTDTTQMLVELIQLQQGFIDLLMQSKP